MKKALSLMGMVFVFNSGAFGQTEKQLLENPWMVDDFSLATGGGVSLPKAPAIASVITAADIESMGARDVDDVLSTVPGLHVSRSGVGYKPLYLIRGIDSSKNGQVLVLIDGAPQTNLFLGDRGD